MNCEVSFICSLTARFSADNCTTGVVDVMNPASVHSARSRSLPSSPASSKGQPKQKDVEDSDSEYKSSSEEDDDDGEKDSLDY